MKGITCLTVIILALFLLADLVGPMISPNGTVMATEETAPEGAAVAEAPAATTPHWAYSKVLWASLALTFSVLGTSWAQSRIGVAGAGAMAEKPELAGSYILLIAIPETMVILGFVVAAMILLMT